MRAARGLPSRWIPALAFALACSACAGGPAEGDGTTDEMCTQGIISWPSDAPRCEPL